MPAFASRGRGFKMFGRKEWKKRRNEASRDVAFYSWTDRIKEERQYTSSADSIGQLLMHENTQFQRQFIFQPVINALPVLFARENAGVCKQRLMFRHVRLGGFHCGHCQEGQRGYLAACA